MFRRILFSLVILTGLSAVPAQAAELSPELQKIVSAAIERDQKSGKYQYLEVALVLIADSQPEQIFAARAYAVEIAPEFSLQIADTFDLKPEEETVTAQVIESPPKQSKLDKPIEEPEVLPGGFWGFDGWSGDIQVGLSLRSGNTNEDELTLAMELENNRKKWRHRTRVRYELLLKDGEVDDDDLLLTYQLNRNITERFYAYAFVRYRNEFDVGYARRFLQNLGVGYKLFDKPKFTMNIEGGPTHRKTTLDEESDPFHEWGGRLTLLSEWKMFRWLTLDFSGSVTLTDQNTSWDMLTGLTSPLTERLSLRITYELEFDTDGPEEDSRIDQRTRANIVYKF